MKDKTAKKLKQKRRSVRQVIKNAEEERILKNFDEIAKKRGIKKFNRKKALQSYKIVENEVTTEGVVNLVVVGAWYLRIKCKWGQKRVCQYIEGVIRYIGVVYNRERDIDKLAEELKDECDFDYEKLMNDFDPLKIKTSTAEQDRIKMVTCAMKKQCTYNPVYVLFNVEMEEETYNRIRTGNKGGFNGYAGRQAERG